MGCLKNILLVTEVAILHTIVGFYLVKCIMYEGITGEVVQTRHTGILQPKVTGLIHRFLKIVFSFFGG